MPDMAAASLTGNDFTWEREMSDVTYETGGAEFLDRIDSMWQQLNEYQAEKSPDFGDAFRGRSIDSRKKRWVASGVNGLRITMAMLDGKDVGYCLSYIGGKMDAVLESLWLDPSLRGRGVGMALTQDALDWFEAKGAKTVDLEVTVGNPTQSFYEKIGFRPFKLGMRLKK